MAMNLGDCRLLWLIWGGARIIASLDVQSFVMPFLIKQFRFRTSMYDFHLDCSSPQAEATKCCENDRFLREHTNRQTNRSAYRRLAVAADKAADSQHDDNADHHQQHHANAAEPGTIVALAFCRALQVMHSCARAVR